MTDEKTASADVTVDDETIEGTAVDDNSKERKVTGVASATKPGYGTKDGEYLKTSECNGCSLDEIDKGMIVVSTTVLDNGTSAGRLSTRYP